MSTIDGMSAGRSCNRTAVGVLYFEDARLLLQRTIRKPHRVVPLYCDVNEYADRDDPEEQQCELTALQLLLEHTNLEASNLLQVGDQLCENEYREQGELWSQVRIYVAQKVTGRLRLPAPNTERYFWCSKKDMRHMLHDMIITRSPAPPIALKPMWRELLRKVRILELFDNEQ